METSVFLHQFSDGLNTLEEEIRKFDREEQLWQVAKGVTNSAGTLVLHLAGNLNHFIGAQLGNSGYVRERDKEFSTKNVPKEQLLVLVATTRATVERTLGTLPDGDLAKTFPLETFGAGRTTHFVLVKLIGHLHYHLGQINYLRRVLSAGA